LWIDEQNEFLDVDLTFTDSANPGIGIVIPDDFKLRPFYFIKLL